MIRVTNQYSSVQGIPKISRPFLGQSLKDSKKKKKKALGIEGNLIVKINSREVVLNGEDGGEVAGSWWGRGEGGRGWHPMGQLAMSRDSFGCHNLGWCDEHLVGRGQRCC